MTNDLETLVALDAVGALTGTERAVLLEHFAAADAETRAAAAVLYDAVAAGVLGATASDRPSPSVRQRLLERLRTEPAAPPYVRRAPARPSFSFLMKDEGTWRPAGVPGAATRPLARRAGKYSMFLLRVEAGVTFPAHHHAGAEELYVVSGSCVIEGRHLTAGDCHHAEPGTDHGESYTEQGCQLLVVAAEPDQAGEAASR